MIFFFRFMLMSLLVGSVVEVPLIIVAVFHYTMMSPAGPFGPFWSARKRMSR
jgi:hypothetical protein